MKKRQNRCECQPGGDDSHSRWHKPARFCSSGDPAAVDGCSVCALHENTVLQVYHLHYKYYLFALSPLVEPWSPRGEPLPTETHAAHTARVHLIGRACEHSWHIHSPGVGGTLPHRNPQISHAHRVHILYHPAVYKSDMPHLRGQVGVGRGSVCTLLVAWTPREYYRRNTGLWKAPLGNEEEERWRWVYSSIFSGCVT